jgi:hypothetical protein
MILKGRQVFNIWRVILTSTVLATWTALRSTWLSHFNTIKLREKWRFSLRIFPQSSFLCSYVVSSNVFLDQTFRNLLVYILSTEWEKLWKDIPKAALHYVSFQLHSACSSPDNIRVDKSGSIWWVRHVARMNEMKESCKFCSGNVSQGGH